MPKIKWSLLLSYIESLFGFQSAVGWDHVEKAAKHDSQKDYKTGFGGKFGVQTDRVDKSALGWEHIEKVEKHESQKGNFNFICKVVSTAVR